MIRRDMEPCLWGLALIAALTSIGTVAAGAIVLILCKLAAAALLD